MKLEGIVKQLANRINQPHVVETYLKKVADTCYKKGLSDAKELEAQSNWIDVKERLPEEGKMVLISTRLQPIVTYAICSWEPEVDCFVNYDDCGYTATHWQEIKPPTE